MKKIFLAICFSFFALPISLALADAVEVKDAAEFAKRQIEQKPVPAPEEVSIESPEEMQNYLVERLKKVVITDLGEDPNQTGSMNIQHSEEFEAEQKEKNKPIYQKIYEQAIARVTAQQNQPQPDIFEGKTIVSKEELERREKAWLNSLDFEVVSLNLPNGEGKILAPAKEHIPYLFADIEVLPSGNINFDETIMVVANGEKLKNGLSRAIPKYSASRTGEQQKINLTLVSVMINGTEVPYKLKETENEILIAPAEGYVLQPGVYTYNFKYVVERRLWYYDDFNEFYWDVSGSTWNMVVARAGARVSLPNGNKPLGQLLLIGYPTNLNNKAGLINNADEQSIGFVSLRPLFIGEGMHIIASVPKDGFEAPSITKKFLWFVDDNGDIFFLALALLAIAVSYFISWKEISSKKLKQKLSLKKNAPMMRFLAKGVCDKISFGAFILDLFKRNIVDVQQSGNDILLVKKTDNLSNMTKFEKLAIDNLFVNKESVMQINSNNALKIKRALGFLEKDTIGRFRMFFLKINAGYLFFSIGMLILAEAFIAYLNIVPLQIFSVLLFTTIAFSLCMFFWDKKPANKYVSKILKISLCIVGLLSSFVASIFIHLTAVLLILAIIYTIFSYTSLFAKRNGLMRSYVAEAQAHKDMLIKDKERLLSNRDFLLQQANVFALDLKEDFPFKESLKDVYRLDIVSEMIKRM